MRAFIVSEPYGDHSAIVFAKSNIEARKWGASEWNDGELGGLICHRCPGFDKFSETGVPASKMIEMGWWFECYNCGCKIDADDYDKRGIKLDDVIGTQHSSVYCNAQCRDDHYARKSREKTVGDEFLEMMRHRVIARFGSVDFVTGAFHEHMFAQEVEGVVIIQGAFVSFNFPGQKIGPASVHYDPGYGIGPQRIEPRCCFGDKQAFEEWADKSPNM